jgi:hypothetical protein
MSASWPDQAFEGDLRKLLRHARAMSRRGIDMSPEGEQREQIVRMSAEEQLVLIEGDGMRLLRALQRRLAGTSRAASGMSPDEARSILVAACDSAVARTIKGAVEELRTELAQPVVEIEVTEPVRLLLPVPKLVVGRVTFKSVVDRRLVGGGWPFSRERGFVAPFASTRVAARGWTSAKVIARQRFAESVAILDLARPPANAAAEWIGFRDVRQPTGAVNYLWSGPLLDGQFVSGTRLAPPYRQLAAKLLREESDRSDWARRLLAATRWYSKSYRTEAPADRLAGAMVALECLFVENRRERYKGTLIAKRLSERFKLRELTAEQQIEWLKRLYAARNEAIHEGRDFVNDLEVDRLLDLTRVTVARLAWHLVPSHRPRGRSCATWREAMRCSGPP